MAKKRSARRPSAPAPAEIEPRPLNAGFQSCVTAALLAIYAGFLAHPIDLTGSDLGRYLKNGELFFQNGLIANTNLFAYTTPDHPFVNHSWGSGVVYYLIERAAGYAGLSLFSLTVSVATLGCFFSAAARYGSFALAAWLTVTVLPVLISRHEIRPEMFSYLMCGLFLNLLWDYRQGRRAVPWLFVLPLLQVLWVNLHIYFFVGIFMVGVFFFEAVLSVAGKNLPGAPSEPKQWRALGAVTLATVAASCINPAGVRGALYPLFIFQGYGFPVIENYSVVGILNAGFQFLPLVYFLIIFGVLVLSWLYRLIKQPASVSVSNLILTVFFSALAWWSIRNLALFAFFSLPLTAANLTAAVGTRSLRRLTSPPGIVLALAAIALVLVLINPVYFFGGGRGAFGIGLRAGNLAALDFLRKEQLHGPIFNNFDVGGYLIYGLFPGRRVYVDNRPEAYPAKFFAEDYFSLLVNEEKWRKAMDTHGFNAIVINTNGRSAAAEDFVIRRMLDPDWAAVFFDQEMLILARRFGPNQPVIAKYELPRDAVLQKAN